MDEKEEVKEKIKLIRGQRGNYGFEIVVTDKVLNEITLGRLKTINKRLKEEYCND